MDSSLIAFLGISAVVIATPGPDTALTIRNTLLGGRRAGVLTALGITIGLVVWTTAAAIGLTAILVASEPVFAAIRIAGGLYLMILGAQSLRAALRPGQVADDPADITVAPGRRPGSPLRQGLLSNLGNPKILVFFSSLLPQFVPSGVAPFPALLALGGVFAAITIVWLGGYAVIVARARDLFLRGAVKRAMDAIAGVILVAFGARLATE
jgi:threonine/homoserine/homoserine lactone efflux protein